jgi:hypothetical protein
MQIIFIIVLMLMLPFFRECQPDSSRLSCTVQKSLISIVRSAAESPRWLARMGREDEARYILAQCRDEDGVSGTSREHSFESALTVFGNAE